MSDSQFNGVMGNTQLTPGMPQAPIGAQTGTSNAAPAKAETVAPVITYNVIIDNQPKEDSLAKTSEQSQQQVLAQLPFNVNTELVYSEDELFNAMYNRIVEKLEADIDACSAGKK